MNSAATEKRMQNQQGKGRNSGGSVNTSNNETKVNKNGTVANKHSKSAENTWKPSTGSHDSTPTELSAQGVAPREFEFPGSQEIK